MLSTIVEVSTIVTNIFLSVGAVIAVFQLIQMKKSNILQSKSLMADHERRKKQSTWVCQDKCVSFWFLFWRE